MRRTCCFCRRDFEAGPKGLRVFRQLRPTRRSLSTSRVVYTEGSVLFTEAESHDVWQPEHLGLQQYAVWWLLKTS